MDYTSAPNSIINSGTKAKVIYLHLMGVTITSEVHKSITELLGISVEEVNDIFEEYGLTTANFVRLHCHSNSSNFCRLYSSTGFNGYEQYVAEYILAFMLCHNKYNVKFESFYSATGGFIASNKYDRNTVQRIYEQKTGRISAPRPSNPVPRETRTYEREPEYEMPRPREKWDAKYMTSEHKYTFELALSYLKDIDFRIEHGNVLKNLNSTDLHLTWGQMCGLFPTHDDVKTVVEDWAKIAYEMERNRQHWGVKSSSEYKQELGDANKQLNELNSSNRLLQQQNEILENVNKKLDSAIEEHVERYTELQKEHNDYVLNAEREKAELEDREETIRLFQSPFINYCENEMIPLVEKALVFTYDYLGEEKKIGQRQHRSYNAYINEIITKVFNKYIINKCNEFYYYFDEDEELNYENIYNAIQYYYGYDEWAIEHKFSLFENLLKEIRLHYLETHITDVDVEKWKIRGNSCDGISFADEFMYLLHDYVFMLDIVKKQTQKNEEEIDIFSEYYAEVVNDCSKESIVKCLTSICDKTNDLFGTGYLNAVLNSIKPPLIFSKLEVKQYDQAVKNMLKLDILPDYKELTQKFIEYMNDEDYREKNHDDDDEDIDIVREIMYKYDEVNDFGMQKDAASLYKYFMFILLLMLPNDYLKAEDKKVSFLEAYNAGLRMNYREHAIGDMHAAIQLEDFTEDMYDDNRKITDIYDVFKEVSKGESKESILLDFCKKYI